MRGREESGMFDPVLLGILAVIFAFFVILFWWMFEGRQEQGRASLEGNTQQVWSGSPSSTDD